jgi:hypothetical protein
MPFVILKIWIVQTESRFKLYCDFLKECDEKAKEKVVRLITKTGKKISSSPATPYLQCSEDQWRFKSKMI